MRGKDSVEVARRLPVAVVVCARNRAATIARCLASVRQANPTEIVVVDGDSVDGTAAIARSHADVVISDGGGGLGAARQLGAMTAATDYLVYVDSDTILLPDTLELSFAMLHQASTTRSRHDSYRRSAPFGLGRRGRPGEGSCRSRLVPRQHWDVTQRSSGGHWSRRYVSIASSTGPPRTEISSSGPGVPAHDSEGALQRSPITRIVERRSLSFSSGSGTAAG